jgi:TrmH family RNA methyltransferase
VSLKLSLLLDGIRDPGNMGTIIRIADWFGVAHIICSEDCVDCYNPKVVQATMGSLAGVDIFYTGLDKFISSNKALNVYAATLSGKDVSGIGKIKEGLLIIGNESTGIRDTLLPFITEQISIPRYGRAESLNAAVACGIILAAIR